MNASANLSSTQILRTYTTGANNSVFCIIRAHWRPAQKILPLQPNEITDPKVTTALRDIIEGELNVDIHFNPHDKAVLRKKTHAILERELSSLNSLPFESVPFAPGAINIARSVWSGEGEITFAQLMPLICNRIAEQIRIQML